MAIVRTDYRRKRPKKRAQPVEIPNPVVTAKPPHRLRGPVKRLGGAQEPAPKAPRIVTVARKPARFGNVPDLSPEEHQRRGDAAEALFRELTRRMREE